MEAVISELVDNYFESANYRFEISDTAGHCLNIVEPFKLRIPLYKHAKPFKPSNFNKSSVLLRDVCLSHVFTAEKFVEFVLKRTEEYTFGLYNKSALDSRFFMDSYKLAYDVIINNFKNFMEEEANEPEGSFKMFTTFYTKKLHFIEEFDIIKDRKYLQMVICRFYNCLLDIPATEQFTEYLMQLYTNFEDKSAAIHYDDYKADINKKELDEIIANKKHYNGKDYTIVELDEKYLDISNFI